MDSPGQEALSAIGLPDSTPKKKHQRQQKTRNFARGFVVNWSESVEVASQLFRARGMSHFTQGLGLDLANPLPRHIKLLTNFFKGMIGVKADSKAHPNDFGLALGKAVENGFCSAGKA